MKKELIICTLIFTFVALNFLSCSDKQSGSPTTLTLDLPAQPYNYGVSNNDAATLGRVLFYDKHLSVNNSIACASCHKQAIAFSDNVRFSSGFENRVTSRNSLPIQNVAFAQELFWDGRQKFLAPMVLKPIVNHVEMGMADVDAVVKKVQTLPAYKDLFFKAYNSYDIDGLKISDALKTFTSSIRSNNTRFDKFLANMTSFTAQEMEGRELFFSKYNCASCHVPQVAAGPGYGGVGSSRSIGMANIGLDKNYADNGLGLITGDPNDNGKFRIPILRNVALTAPYMHDGRFTTLDDVLEHYSHGIAKHKNLDQRLRDTDNQPKKFNISDQEKTALIAFLNTLTDYTVVTDPKFSNPFKVK
ncbi:MAG: cytochrome c peroxidase [Bacteroidia bacterium]